MARKSLFNIAEADSGRPAYRQAPSPASPTVPETTSTDTALLVTAAAAPSQRRQAYREGKRAVMFFLSEEAFSHMHVLLARQGRKKVQQLMEELVDDWFRRENAPRLLK
jgi:hypothetical protein